MVCLAVGLLLDGRAQPLVDLVLALVGPEQPDLARAPAVLRGDDPDAGPGEGLEALGDLLGGGAERPLLAGVEVGADEDGPAGHLLLDDLVLRGVDPERRVVVVGVAEILHLAHLQLERLVETAQRGPVLEARPVVLHDPPGERGERVRALLGGPGLLRRVAGASGSAG